MLKTAQVISSLSAGGAENLVLNLALIAQDPSLIEVWSIGICRNPEYEKEFIKKLSEKGIRVIKFNKRKGKDYLRTILMMRKAIIKNRINLVNTHSELAAFYVIASGLFLKITVIQTIHNIVISYKKLQKYFAKMFIDHWVTVSKNIKTGIINKLSIRSEEITVIYNGINTDKFNCAERKHETVRLIINIARLEYQKDHKNLILAYEMFISKLRTEETIPELLIIGEGILHKDLKQEISSRKLDKFITILENTSVVERYLRQADLFILSSLYEGLPIVVIEAMASGLPVISTDVGGVNELIEDGVNGILVEKHNPGKLAGALYTLYGNSCLREYYSNNNIEKAKEFSSSDCINSYYKLYADLNERRFASN